MKSPDRSRSAPAQYGLRPEPFYLGVGFVILGLVLSISLIRETKAYAVRESPTDSAAPRVTPPTSREIFWETTFYDRTLSSTSQVGFVNNLNDALTWGLFPLVFAAAGMTINRNSGRDLSGNLGNCAAWNRPRIGQGRPQVAYRIWHVGPSSRYRRRHRFIRFHRFCDRSSSVRVRHCNGVPNFVSRRRRCRASVMARIISRRVSPLARPWICRRGAGGWTHSRPIWDFVRNVGCGGSDPFVGNRSRRADDGNPSSRKTHGKE
jgi:hypothetical protein